jgi:hypothetical protein
MPRQHVSAGVSLRIEYTAFSEAANAATACGYRQRRPSTLTFLPKNTVAPIMTQQLVAKRTLNQIEGWSNPRLDNKMESLSVPIP